MPHYNHLPIANFDNLRDRIIRMLKFKKLKDNQKNQLSFELDNLDVEVFSNSPSKDVYEFINFLSDAMPDGDIYLFGGVIRDIALFGKRGFSSDIDIVADGDCWSDCVSYLESHNAVKNKFGGYRLIVDGWPIDIWNAKETWAFKNGLVKYDGVSSLIKTTVLNWDAILMNWRTKNFICCDTYISNIQQRKLDVVLKSNPNPIGMAVRVFRHLCAKDARKITYHAAEYLADVTSIYSFDDIMKYEINSYGKSYITSTVYKFFEKLKKYEHVNVYERFDIASSEIQEEEKSKSFQNYKFQNQDIFLSSN